MVNSLTQTRWEDANYATAQPNITRPLLSLYVSNPFHQHVSNI